MAREGTRSATGNSKPRIFAVPEPVAPVKRAKANTGAKRGPKTTTTKKVTTTKAAKPVGVTKKKTPVKKPTLATKAKGVVKKVKGEITGNPAEKAAGTKKIKGTDVAAGKKAAKTTAAKKK